MLLLKYDFKCNVSDERGYDPCLMLAIEKNSLDFVKAFYRSNNKPSKFETNWAMAYASQAGVTTPIVEYLLSKGANALLLDRDRNKAWIEGDWRPKE